MAVVYEGSHDGTGKQFAIVVSRYNDQITSKLLAGAMQTLVRHGVLHSDIHVAWVPGAWELPLATDRFAQLRRFAGVLSFGAVIRGETSHDQHINRQVSLSLGEIALRTGTPVAFGLLTCDTMQQAQERAGGEHGNKGEECALAALEMANLLPQLRSQPATPVK